MAPLFYAGVVALTVVTGLLFGVAGSALVILVFSASFGGYLAERFTTSFQIATFAKATCMLLFFAGITMLVVSLGWWGLIGIIAYWLLFALSWRFWHQRQPPDS
jgi:hypothetical protein